MHLPYKVGPSKMLTYFVYGSQYDCALESSICLQGIKSRFLLELE